MLLLPHHHAVVIMVMMSRRMPLHAMLWIIIRMLLLLLRMVMSRMLSLMRMMHSGDHDRNDRARRYTLRHRNRHSIHVHGIPWSKDVGYACLDGGVSAIVGRKRVVGIVELLLLWMVRVMVLILLWMVGMTMIVRTVVQHGTATTTRRRWWVGIAGIRVHGMKLWIVVVRMTATAIVQGLMIWHLMVMNRLRLLVLLLLHPVASRMSSGIHELRDWIGVFDFLGLLLLLASLFFRCLLQIFCRCLHHCFLCIL
mmetsp:Transcript_39039/g.84165  ORF Transcript_39039/g.84165 Transcript_39039/m.84165 type:complete len:253 (-) Transcript_39039:1424-2182(-)